MSRFLRSIDLIQLNLHQLWVFSQQFLGKTVYFLLEPNPQQWRDHSPLTCCWWNRNSGQNPLQPWDAVLQLMKPLPQSRQSSSWPWLILLFPVLKVELKKYKNSRKNRKIQDKENCSFWLKNGWNNTTQYCVFYTDNIHIIKKLAHSKKYKTDRLKVVFFKTPFRLHSYIRSMRC